MRSTRRLAKWRWLALVATFAMVAAACDSTDDSSTEDGGTTTATEAPAPTAATLAPTTTESPTTTDAARPVPTGTLTFAIFEDITTDNVWAGLDAANSVWTSYVHAPTYPTLYTLSFPNYILIPDAAAEPEVPVGGAEGDTWVIDVAVRPGLTWSDGEAIDANDVAFTASTAINLKLRRDFLSFFPAAVEDDPETTDVDETADGLISVEAIDDLTVRYTWSRRPGLAEWHFGTAQGPIFPEHFWADTVAAASSAGDLYAASGAGMPSGGPLVYESREAGARVRSTANLNHVDAGSINTAYDSGGFEYSALDGTSYSVGDTSGAVVAEWTGGPHIADVTYSVYETQDAAVLALADGDADYLLTPLGLEQGLRGLVLESDNLEIISNPALGFRYLSFNTRKFPMNDAAFRQALACMIDKTFIATNVLQGAAIPQTSLVPEGNAFWANPAVTAWCAGQTQEERVASAIQLLKDAGWTWDVEPQWNEDNLDVIPKGEGLRGPDGSVVGELELLAPGPGYDPLRATFALFVEDWAQDLGIPLKAEPTGFNVIVDQVFATGEAAREWDMYILGWGISIYPDYLAEFFMTANDSADGGFNTSGYSNPDFDALGEQLKATIDIHEAADLVKQMDAIIADEVPYIVLFTTPVLEAYRSSLQFPATATLDGIQNFHGLPGAVQVSQ